MGGALTSYTDSEEWEPWGMSFLLCDIHDHLHLPFHLLSRLVPFLNSWILTFNGFVLNMVRDHYLKPWCCPLLFCNFEVDELLGKGNIE